MGPVLAYENNVENGILPPQFKSTSDVEIGCKEQYASSKVNSNPYMQAESRGGGGIDGRLLQAESRFVTAGAVASHGDVGGMQLELLL